MRGRMCSWSVAVLAISATLLGGCRKPPNPFEPVVSGEEAVVAGITAHQGNGKLLVTKASGRAAIAGVEQGDVVVSVNGAPVATMRELNDAIRASGKIAALLIERGNERIHVQIPHAPP